MEPIILGIDPGATGAIAAVHGTTLRWVVDMPYANGMVMTTTLAAIVREAKHQDWHTVAVVEQVGAMPKQGVASTFRFGTGYGAILGVLGALDVRTELVPPSVWKKAMALTNRGKGASRELASRLWPDQAARFSRVKDDGRAEAALLAEYHRRRLLSTVLR